MNQDELIEKLRVDSRLIRVCDVADIIIESMIILDERSASHRDVREKMEKSYNGMMNGIMFTLMANLALFGKSKEESLKMAKELAESGDYDKIGIAIVTPREDA